CDVGQLPKSRTLTGKSREWDGTSSPRATGLPRGRIRIFAVAADLAAAERKDLRPPDLDDTACGANSAAFVTEYDDLVALGNEFVRLEDFELQRRGQRRQILLATLTPSPRAAPTRYDRRAGGDRWDELGVVGRQVEQRREIPRNERRVDPLDDLEMPLVA